MCACAHVLSTVATVNRRWCITCAVEFLWQIFIEQCKTRFTLGHDENAGKKSGDTTCPQHDDNAADRVGGLYYMFEIIFIES